MAIPKYRRVLIKLGGEALAGQGGFGISPHMAEEVAAKIKAVKNLDIEIALVLGAGNLWRGKDGLAHGMERATADHMGMIATVMNALAGMRSAAGHGYPRAGGGRDAHYCRAVHPAARYPPPEKGRIVIIGAGTGNRATTDTAAARMPWRSAPVLIKATKVDGVYPPTRAPTPMRL
jgi:uridylate kinase